MSELDWMLDAYEEPEDTACRICGKHGLQWDDDIGNWRLVESSGLPHLCNPADVLLHAVSDFKDCDE